jgi:hypothetical protein
MTGNESTALAEVARHFSATLEEGAPRSGALLRIGGRTIALEVLAFTPTPARSREAVKPRLRLDRVAVGLIDRLRVALGNAVPDDRTLVVTITAPIRRAAKTAAAIEDRIRLRLKRRSAGRGAGRIHGNRVQMWVLEGGTALTSKLVGFVHNPDRDPAILIELTRTLLAASGPERGAGRGARGRWLVIEDRAGLLPIDCYRNVCGQLRLGVLYEQILVIPPGGGVEKLSCR